MEYRQGFDRVGDSTSFPFPIKLEYDSENIYLTPLWIPETSDILVAKDKITKQPINLLDANELGNLWLCIEVKDGYYMPKKYNKKTQHYEKIDHPQRGGKYHLSFGNYSREDYQSGQLNTRMNNEMQNYIVMGRTYAFPYLARDFHNHGGERSLIRLSEGKWGPSWKRIIHDSWFVYVRGTYRYGGTRYCIDHKRTGIYSNVVKLEFDLDSEND